MSEQQTVVLGRGFLDFSERAGTEKRSVNVLERLVKLLFRPATAWKEIAVEEGGLLDVFVPYVVTLVVIGELLGYAGSTLLGSLFSFVTGTGMSLSLGDCLMSLVGSLVGGALATLVLAKVLELVAPGLGGKRSWVLSTRVVAYGLTPVYVTQAFAWLPFIGLLICLIAFIRTVFLWIQGFRIVLKG